MSNKRWRKLYQKYILKQRQYNIMKIIKKIKTRKEEIYMNFILHIWMMKKIKVIQKKK